MDSNLFSSHIIIIIISCAFVLIKQNRDAGVEVCVICVSQSEHTREETLMAECVHTAESWVITTQHRLMG